MVLIQLPYEIIFCQKVIFNQTQLKYFRLIKVYKNRLVIQYINQLFKREGFAWKCKGLQYQPPFILFFEIMKQTNQVQNQNNNFKSSKQSQNSQTFRSNVSSLKQSQFILKQQQIINPFQYKKVQKEIKCIVEEVIQQKLKERNTILLAKIGKQNIFGSQYEDKLIFKSLDQINQFYSSQICSSLISKIVRFLKSNKFQVKVAATAVIIQNSKTHFNLGGMCYWDGISDGQATITKKIPTLKISENQELKYNSFDRQGTLIVTVYLCGFQKKFRNN